MSLLHLDASGTFCSLSRTSSVGQVSAEQFYKPVWKVRWDKKSVTNDDDDEEEEEEEKE